MSNEQSAEAPAPLRQQQLVEGIARLIADSQTSGWKAFTYQIRALAGYQQDEVLVTRPDGTVEQKFPPDDLIDQTEELRTAMYRAGAGTWFSATLSVDRSGSMSADFNYDQEPDWSRPVEPEWYVKDLEKFPRDESAIPNWLRQRLAEAHTAR
jgi:hypothetical protein